MNDTQRAIEFLRRALAILEDETPEPNEPAAQTAPWEVGEGEVVLLGAIARPDLKTVGDNIPLFTAGIKTIRETDGRVQWYNLQAWRKTALWASENLDSGVKVRAIGRFETNSWTGPDGEQREKTVFSVRLFEAT